MAATDASPPTPDDVARLLRDVARPPLGAVDAGGPPVLDSRFHVLRRLGAGGFGVVYLVRDAAIGIDVALKALPFGRPELLYRLKREFRALADLRHPNLVSFYELFAADDRCFFTMEYVPGVTFLEHVRPGGALDEARLRDALRQLATGLAALHGAGKLHRDVKPSNVLVTPEGRVVLLDLGLATDLEATGAGRSTELAGTPEYMSPEHALGVPVSPASDWYAVGVMLYHALAGRLPFEGTWAELARRDRADPPWPGGPADLVRLCRSLLTADPALRAGAPEVLAAAGQAPSVASASGVPVHAPLVGRERELDTLRRALEDARAAEGITILVDGPSGIGKTALVERFLEEVASDAATVVLRGRCYERERVPYQGVDSLVDDLCRLLRRLDVARVDAVLPRHVGPLVRLFPVLQGVPAIRAGGGDPGPEDEQGLRRAAFAALRELLARIADRRRLVVHVDDLQWGDADTGALLDLVLRRPDAPGMLAILCHRSEDLARSPCLQALADGVRLHARHLHLAPLTRGDAEALARQVVGEGKPGVDLARIVADAGGNPFFIHELGRFAAVAAPHDGGVGLEAALRARVARLPEAARRLLEVVAVAGHPVRDAVAVRAAELPGPPWDAWATLGAARLVRFSGPAQAREAEPLHDRIRETVVAALPPRRATECHRGLAAALEAAGGADPEVLARHHAAAGEVERARALAAEAATQAERALAFDRAARLFRWALELGGEDHRERADLRAALARALAHAGRGEEAAAAYLSAAREADAAARIELRRAAALQLLLSGRVDEGQALAAENLRALGLAIARTPRRAMASIVAHRTVLWVRGLRFRERPEREVPTDRLALLDHLWTVNRGLSLVDVIRGAELATRHLLLALRAGEPHRIAHGIAMEAAHVASEAPYSRRARALYARLDALDARLDDPLVHGYVTVARFARSGVAGEWRSTIAFADEAERTFRERATGDVFEIWAARTFATWALYFLGDWREMLRRIGRHLAEGRDRGNVYATAISSMPLGVVGPLSRGDVDEARRMAREAIESWSMRGVHLQHLWFASAETLIDLYAGNGAAAWERLAKRWSALRGSQMLRIPILSVPILHERGLAALAAAATATPDSGRMLVRDADRCARALERTGVAYGAAMASLLRAGSAALLGRPDDALRRLDQAIAAFDALEMVPFAHAARDRRARLLGEAPPPFEPLPLADPDAMVRTLAPAGPWAP